MTYKLIEFSSMDRETAVGSSNATGATAHAQSVSGSVAADQQSASDGPNATNGGTLVRRAFSVTSAKFYYCERVDKPEPIIEIGVRNDTEHTIGCFSFCATLRSTDRKAPWAEDYFEYRIEGGLKPGAEAQWRLSPSTDTDWGNVPRDGDGLMLRVVPIEIEDVQGNPIPECRLEEKGNPFLVPSDNVQDWTRCGPKADGPSSRIPPTSLPASRPLISVVQCP